MARKLTGTKLTLRNLKIHFNFMNRWLIFFYNKVAPQWLFDCSMNCVICSIPVFQGEMINSLSLKSCGRIPILRILQGLSLDRSVEWRSKKKKEKENKVERSGVMKTHVGCHQICGRGWEKFKDCCQLFSFFYPIFQFNSWIG